jgi:serine/threonine-protein kinase RsbW
MKTDLALTSRLDEVGHLASTVRSILAENNVAFDMIDALELALVEAVNNVIEHAYRMETGRRIDVSVQIEAREIAIRIADTGLSFDPHAFEDQIAVPQRIDDLPEGNMGLAVMKQLASELRYTAGPPHNVMTLIWRLT